jgi:hypothetical protein
VFLSEVFSVLVVSDAVTTSQSFLNGFVVFSSRICGYSLLQSFLRCYSHPLHYSPLYTASVTLELIYLSC